MIKLMKSTFINEKETKKKLCDFIMGTDKLSMGDKCKEFEYLFSQKQGRKYAVLFSSGSSANLALIQSLLNLGKIKRGDLVGVSSITWATNIFPLIQLGLNPVPIDISKKTLNIFSEEILESKKKYDLKAIFITNLLGFCGDLDKIKEICNAEDMLLLEDSCECLGSKLGGINVGNFGFASTFSTFVGHHLSTIEGGFVCTDDEKLYEMLLMVRAHGWSRQLKKESKEILMKNEKVNEFFEKYTFYNLGYNLRPTEITGVIGLEQLNYLDEIIEKRKINFEFINELVNDNSEIQNLDLKHMESISNFAYPLIFKDKILFEKYKHKFENDVEIRPIVGGNICDQPFFKKYMKETGRFYECPNAKEVSERGFYIPNNPELTQEELDLFKRLLIKE